MSQAEELLQGLSAGATTFADDVNYVSIENRHLIVPAHLQRLGVSADHGVNTVHFVGPRYSENGTDLSKMNIYVNYRRSEDEYEDKALCTNVKVDASDNSLLHYDWVITRNVTEIPGTVTVIVCAKESDGTGNEDEHWNTELYSDFYVSEGMEVDGDGIINQQPDLVDSMLDRIKTVENKTTTSAMVGYVDRYLDENPDVITDHIEDIVADQPIQEFVDAYLDDYVDIGTTDSRVLEGSKAGAYEMVSMAGVSEQKSLEGNQLIDFSAIKESGATVVVADNGKVVKVTGKQAYANANVSINIENLIGKTIYLSGSISGGTRPSYTVRLYRQDGTNSYLTDISNGYTVLAGDSYIMLQMIVNNTATAHDSDVTVTFTETMISTVKDTQWEPYCGGKAAPNPDYPQEIKSVGPEVTVKTTNVDGTLSSSAKITLPEPLRGIGDARDVIEKRDGKWGVERRIKRVVFDGSADEVWAQSSSRTDLFFTTMKDIKVNYCRAKCNQYIEQIVSANLKDGDMYAYNSYFGMQRVSFINSSCETLDGWKSQLQSNPITVDYELATPTWEELDEATQEALDSLQAYDGTTHVFVEGTEVQPIVVSKYGTSEVGARALSNTNAIEKTNDRIEKEREACDQRFDLLEIQTSEDYEIHGCKAGGLRLTEMTGKTEQKTLSGKNLLPAPDMTNVVVGVSITVKDGVITSNGTASDSGGRTNYIATVKLPAGVYYFSCSDYTGNVFDTICLTNTATSTLITASIGSFTLQEETTVGFGLNFLSGVTYSGSTKIQLEAGTVATDYEPYCGGTPSPNPDYPQAIENVGDCVEIMQGGYAPDTGNFFSSSKFVCCKRPIPCKSGDAIKISNKNAKDIKIVYFTDGEHISYNTSGSGNGEFTAPSGVTSFMFDFYNTSAITPQTVGKITLTVNGKYVGQIVEHGKNLYETNDSITNNGFLEVGGGRVGVKDGSYVMTVTGVDPYFVPAQSKFHLADGETYYFYAHADKACEVQLWTNTGRLASNGGTFVYSSSTKYHFELERTTVGQTYKVKIVISKHPIENIEAVEPYQEKVATILLDEPLRATDRLVRKDGVIYENHRRGSVVLDSTLFDSDYGSTDTMAKYWTKQFDKLATDSADCLCTHFPKSDNSSTLGAFRISNGSSKTVFVVEKTQFPTLDDFKAWVDENNVEVEYDLAEETYTPLDTASQIAINGLETFKDVTYLEVDSKVKPESMEYEYGKSGNVAYTLKALLNSESNAVRLEEILASASAATVEEE